MDDEGRIETSTIGEGQGGVIKIKADTVTMRDGAAINSNTFGNGAAGTVTVKATQGITLRNEGHIRTATEGEAR